MSTAGPQILLLFPFSSSLAPSFDSLLKLSRRDPIHYLEGKTDLFWCAEKRERKMKNLFEQPHQRGRKKKKERKKWMGVLLYEPWYESTAAFRAEARDEAAALDTGGGGG